MRYYFLKIGKANKEAKNWLKGKNPLHKPAVLTYFGWISKDQILNGENTANLPRESFQQAKNFCESGLPVLRENTRMITVFDGDLWITKPSSEVKDLADINITQDEKNIWKMMEVEISEHLLLTDDWVPPSLIGITSNQYLIQGTFREVTSKNNPGSIKAIEKVLFGSISENHFVNKKLASIDLLDCLGSVELETLVAKIFESEGCFVPAYLGGTIKEIDLIVRNDHPDKKDIDLDGLRIKHGKKASIQVKTKTNSHNHIGSDYLIAANKQSGESVFGADWLLNQIKKHNDMRTWFLKVVDWLPSKFLNQFGL